MAESIPAADGHFAIVAEANRGKREVNGLPRDFPAVRVASGWGVAATEPILCFLRVPPSNLWQVSRQL